MASVFLSFVAGLDAPARAACWRGRPLCALVTLRMLSDVAQQQVLRLLFGPQSLEPDASLVLAGVVEERALDGMCALHADFCAALRRGLAGDTGALGWTGAPLLRAAAARVEEEADQRWESLLQAVGDPGGQFGRRRYEVDERVARVLKRLGLQGKKQLRESLHFVLADSCTQLWTLLLGSLRDKEAAQVAEQLELVCALVLAQPYRRRASDAPALSDSCKKMLKLASSLGLYCQDVPTAAIRVLSDAHQGGKEARPPHDSSAGWIVVENNFRVYAYTSRVSAMRILSIFVRLEYRLPNLVVGTITRQSARSALMDWGVSVEQIEAFLINNCHPQMRHKNPIVPDAISDALRSWAAETNRMELLGEGVMLDGFPSKAVFDHSVRWAQQHNCFVWSKPWDSGGLLFVTSADELTQHLAKLDVDD